MASRQTSARCERALTRDSQRPTAATRQQRRPTQKNTKQKDRTERQRSAEKTKTGNATEKQNMRNDVDLPQQSFSGTRIQMAFLFKHRGFLISDVARLCLYFCGLRSQGSPSLSSLAPFSCLLELVRFCVVLFLFPNSCCCFFFGYYSLSLHW